MDTRLRPHDPDSRHHDVASDEGGRRAAAVYSLTETCKLNDVDPRAWLADVLAKLPDHPAHRIAEMMPWAWKARQAAVRVTTAVAA